MIQLNIYTLSLFLFQNFESNHAMQREIQIMLTNTTLQLNWFSLALFFPEFNYDTKYKFLV
jgi:hypothetical protein